MESFRAATLAAMSNQWGWWQCSRCGYEWPTRPSPELAVADAEPAREPTRAQPARAIRASDPRPGECSYKGDW